MLDIIIKIFVLIVILAFSAPVLYVIVKSIFIIKTRAWEQEDDEL